MSKVTRKIEIFSAGCSVCKNLIAQVKAAACPSCDVNVLDMKAPAVQERAAGLGIESVPAVVIDGKLANCCSSRGVDLNSLRAAGLGQPMA